MRNTLNVVLWVFNEKTGRNLIKSRVVLHLRGWPQKRGVFCKNKISGDSLMLLKMTRCVLYECLYTWWYDIKVLMWSKPQMSHHCSAWVREWGSDGLQRPLVTTVSTAPVGSCGRGGINQRFFREIHRTLRVMGGFIYRCLIWLLQIIMF